MTDDRDRTYITCTIGHSSNQMTEPATLGSVGRGGGGLEEKLVVQAILQSFLDSGHEKSFTNYPSPF